MVNLNLKKEIKDLEGNSLQQTTMAKLLASVLVSTNEGDAIKYYDWAKELYGNENLVIDESSYQELFDFVKKNAHFYLSLNLVVNQNSKKGIKLE